MCEQVDSFRGVEYSKSVANFYTPENLEPEADWHPRIPGIVYWGKSTIGMTLHKHAYVSRDGLVVSWIQYGVGKTTTKISWQSDG